MRTSAALWTWRHPRLYELGLQYFDQYTLDEFIKARGFFERAVDRDPRFATAWAQLSISLATEVGLSGSGKREDMVSEVFESARRAVALDARDPAAQTALGAAHLAAGDPKTALDSIQRAVNLNPSMPVAWVYLGWAQVLAGNPEAAIAASERAQQLDPQGPMIWIYENLAVANWGTRAIRGGARAGTTAGRDTTRVLHGLCMGCDERRRARPARGGARGHRRRAPGQTRSFPRTDPGLSRRCASRLRRTPQRCAASGGSGVTGWIAKPHVAPRRRC